MLLLFSSLRECGTRGQNNSPYRDLMVMLALSPVATLILKQMYVWKNKRRNKHAAESGTGHMQDAEFMDWMDQQNLEFRVSFGSERKRGRDC